MLRVKSPLGRVFSLRRRRSKQVMSVSLPDIREDSVVEGRSSLATVTSAFQEEELKPTLTTPPPQLTTPSPQLTVSSPQPTTPSPKLTPRRSLPVVHVGANVST